MHSHIDNADTRVYGNLKRRGGKAGNNNKCLPPPHEKIMAKVAHHRVQRSLINKGTGGSSQGAKVIHQHGYITPGV